MSRGKIVLGLAAGVWATIKINDQWKCYKHCKSLVDAKIGFDAIGWRSSQGFIVFNRQDEENAKLRLFDNTCKYPPESRVYVDSEGNAYRRDSVLSSHNSCGDKYSLVEVSVHVKKTITKDGRDNR